MREGYKKTKIGVLPEDWRVKKIDNIVTYMKSGISRKLSDQDIGIPCIRSSNIVDGKLNKKDMKYWYLEDTKGANIREYILDRGDLLINFINSLAQIGKTCIYTDIGRDAIYTTNIFRIKLNTTTVDTRFVYYFTLTDKYDVQIFGITKPAVNQASFTSKDLKKTKVPVPPLREQKKISSILSSVDKHIEEVDVIIKDLKELRKGLMQKLLTGQYTIENGKLVKTREFKKTMLGMIPKHWEVKKLEDILNIGPQNGLYKSKNFYEGEYNIVELIDLYNNYKFIKISNLSKITLTDKEISLYGLNHNDLLVNRVSKAVDGVARVMLFKGSDTDTPTVFESNMMRVTLNFEVMNSEFMFYYSEHEIFRKEINKFAKTSNQTSISQDSLKSIKVCVPPTKEQEIIVAILDSYDKRIELYKKEKQDIKQLRKGLIQKLLTGKIRVKV